jgi:antitoxin FitA
MLTWRGSRRFGGPHDWNVPDEVHRALRVRAARHGRSAEAEIRNILERAMKPAKRVRLGDALAALGRKVGLTDEDIAATDQTRDKSPVAGTLLKASASDRPWCGTREFRTEVAFAGASRGKYSLTRLAASCSCFVHVRRGQRH